MDFDKKKYSAEYNKNNYTGYSFRLHKDKEADLIDFLAHRNTKDYIIGLIRKDIRQDSRKKFTIRGSSYAHNHIDEYPLEVLEELPGDHYSIGYVQSLDDAALLIMNHCDRGTPAGPICVVHRQVCRKEKDGKMFTLIGGIRTSDEQKETDQPAGDERA